MRERIGVYICHCGGNISDYVDVKKVVEAVKDLPGVAIARDFVFMCSEAGQELIKKDIKELNLDGVVVASCSPHLHEKTFRDAAKAAGLNPYVVEHVCIREHSSWVHSDNPEAATQKAIWIVKTAIAKVRLAREMEPIRIKMKPEAIVVGGGIAGMRCAIDLAKAGVNVHLIEKSPFLGGRAAQIFKLYPSGKSGKDLVREIVEELRRYPNIHVYTNAKIVSAEGALGDFKIKIEVEPRYVKSGVSKDEIEKAIERCPVEVPDEFNWGLTKRKAIYYRDFTYPDAPVIDMSACTKCGECGIADFDQKPQTIEITGSIIILATGAKPYEPEEGKFGYKVYDNVVTLPVFDRLLDICEGTLTYNGKTIRTVAFIYCVGSRGDVHDYCSRYCCVATLNAALGALEKFGVRSYHIYRDIRTYGKYETYYEEAGRNRMVFIKYDPENPPVVERFGDKLIVKVKDMLTGGEEIEIPVDMVVLSVGMELEESEIFTMLRVPFSVDGFLQEVHPKLRPVETAIGGVLLAGACQFPKDTVETTASASAAVAKADSYLVKGYAEIEPYIAEIDSEKCDGCGECVDECPTGAISIQNGKAVIREALCKGCGACGAVCPNEAINLRGYRYDQLTAMIDALKEG